MAEYTSGAQKVYNLNRRVNHVTKEKMEDGTWRYTVVGKDGGTLAEMDFITGRDHTNRLTNSDLLEIVRDRLGALNRGPNASERSRMCLTHVCEALFWADMNDNRLFAENEADENTEE